MLRLAVSCNQWSVVSFFCVEPLNLLIMIWLAILIILVFGFILLCVNKIRIISRKESERRNIIDEMEIHEILEHYKDFDDYV